MSSATAWLASTIATNDASLVATAEPVSTLEEATTGKVGRGVAPGIGSSSSASCTTGASPISNSGSERTVFGAAASVAGCGTGSNLLTITSAGGGSSALSSGASGAEPGAAPEKDDAD